MKTLRRWFTRNRVLSHLRITTAVTLMSAAAAMAFVAGSDRLLTISRPSTDLSQDREAKGKIAGDPDAVLRSSRTTPGEGPVGGAPTRVPGDCRLWVATAGGGVWRTNDALAASPSWTWLTGVLDLNSVGALVADPNDASGNTLYVGTGEGNRCSSGCEAGVGIYKTTNGGNTWTKLSDACVNNTTYSCANSGDAFLGRGINRIVVDPTNP